MQPFAQKTCKFREFSLNLHDTSYVSCILRIYITKDIWRLQGDSYAPRKPVGNSADVCTCVYNVTGTDVK